MATRGRQGSLPADKKGVRQGGPIRGTASAASASAETTKAPNEARLIGQKIATQRRTRGFTLEQLATLTGFTKGYLSKVENGLKSPPIGSLASIADALGVSMSEFFVGTQVPASNLPVSIVRKAERQPVVRGGTNFGYDYQSIAFKRASKHMEPFVFRFPQEGEVDVFFQHEGEEMVFILTGTVHFEFGSREQLTRWLLEPGDCAYFDSRVPHRGYAVGGEATALVVVANMARGSQ